MPYFNVLMGGKISTMRRMPKFAFVITFVAFGLTACIGTVPVFVTDVDIGNFSLSWYSPPNDRAGSYTMQVNPQELYINQTYMTSDGVTHIVLKGTIDSGVPAGLLWSNGPVNGYTGGTYGYDMTTLGGSYGGYGDFKAGTLGASTGGSFAIGSLDFSAEWMMAAPYSAFVIKGLVEDNADVTVTETNNSLNLYSFDYRTDETNGYFTSSNGIRQKITRYSPQSNLDKPNSFRKVNANNPGQSRGGYMLLISKHASPPAAMVEVNYTDGTKKKYSIDYSGVNFKEVELTGIDFQTPTPTWTMTPAGAYIIDNPPVRDESYNKRLVYTITNTLYAGSISMIGGSIIQPLYLRPLYTPIKETAGDGLDPRSNTTNMIHRIWFEMTASTLAVNTYYGKDNFTLAWDDVTQSITFYRNEKAAPLYDSESVDITIHAELRKPYNPSDGSGPIQEFTFDFTVTGTDPPPPP
jgi:hypothetical protein